MSKSKNTETALSETNQVSETKFDREAFISECGSKSAAIRKLSADGKSRGEIAKMLELRYQHVRNVLITPVKKTANANG